MDESKIKLLKKWNLISLIMGSIFLFLTILYIASMLAFIFQTSILDIFLAYIWAINIIYYSFVIATNVISIVAAVITICNYQEVCSEYETKILVCAIVSFFVIIIPNCIAFKILNNIEKEIKKANTIIDEPPLTINFNNKTNINTNNQQNSFINNPNPSNNF